MKLLKFEIKTKNEKIKKIKKPSKKPAILNRIEYSFY